MFIVMAQIVGAVGLRGELKAVVTADFDEQILASRFLRLHEGQRVRPAELRSWRWKGETPILRLSGIEDRDAAEALRGRELGFAADDYDHAEFPRPEPPLPFVFEGLRAETEAGQLIGRVEQLLAWPGQRMLRIRREDGSEALVPAVAPLLQRVDRAAGKVVIRPIPGLLDDDAEIVG